MLKEYNNNTILEIKDVRPVNDDLAIERGNSLRLLAVSNDVDKYFECKNSCNNNKDCAYFDFDKENTTCKLYRKEPYKKVEKVNKDLCLEICQRDLNCDYLHHTTNNDCYLFTRENIDKEENAISNIDNLWFDFAIYGINKDKAVKVKNFDECSEKNNNANYIYYDKSKLCIPKTYYLKSMGDTAIYINRTPLDKYSSLLNKFIGFKSKDRNFIDKCKLLLLVVIIFILCQLLYDYAKQF